VKSVWEMICNVQSATECSLFSLASHRSTRGISSCYHNLRPWLELYLDPAGLVLDSWVRKFSFILRIYLTARRGNGLQHWMPHFFAGAD